MQAFLDNAQAAHDPKHFMQLGRLRPNPEQPARIAALQAGAQAAGATFRAPDDHGLGPIARLHSPAYLAFLQTIHARWQSLPDPAPEVIANIHPVRHAGSYPSSPVGQAGWHQADTSCPIGAETWRAAYWLAQTAIAAARGVGSGTTYALCRPPGHHAFGDLAGGFCYLNNAAIAAADLTARGARVAVFDIDVHHGNGTQGIFYDRADVLTVSIHADPAGFYPFHWGHACERGGAAAEGYNLNLPLPRGTDDAAYLAALPAALGAIRNFGADVLVLALGLDAHINDPFQGFAVTTAGFTRIAAAIAALRLPTVIVQEGGYLSPDLGPNLTAFLAGWQG